MVEMEKYAYILTVGLEIHAELKTRTKMFCDSKNDPDETRPNVNICPVCIGHPGTLPVINKEAVRHVLKVGVAIGGTLADKSSFDRKNYFYPDIPKGYQISQYTSPLVSGGSFNGVAITRVHLEEDTGTSLHDKGNYSLLDFNRAGVPLMELVTEPVIHSAKDASHFARELQLLLRYLGASDANMEKGEMRVEANISVIQESRFKNNELGTKVEVKNLNSFKTIERAIEYEVKRQSALLEQGKKVTQETCGWDEAKQQTFLQRRKEESHDYRYFPEPDLPTLHISSLPEFSVEALKRDLPELPSEKRARYAAAGASSVYAEMFVYDARYGKLFEDTLACMNMSGKNRADTAVLAANYIGTDIAGLVANHGEAGLAHITPEGLSAVVILLLHDEISSRGAKDAITEVFEKDGDLAEISKKYMQQSDENELKKYVKKIIAGNERVVIDYKAGKESALQFLVGQCMKATRGAGNPQMLRELLIKEMLLK
ncbi:MAG: aspartyl-tRNA(Asn)/glutamyl-tRNA (Gln) amidotransferase subunit B [Parcubacteria group bacterium Gr01-1014_17]|nr:MAG: aspartyl-tRNA(Asn)/glutamyl-tRNA (Gln) amidotransferase subunit B [Parcubacteria group bacterium Gr01-1014_17]